MKRTLSGIMAASIVLGTIAPGARARAKDGRLTGGYILGPDTSRGHSRQTFAAVANHSHRKGRRHAR